MIKLLKARYEQGVIARCKHKIGNDVDRLILRNQSLDDNLIHFLFHNFFTNTLRFITAHLDLIPKVSWK